MQGVLAAVSEKGNESARALSESSKALSEAAKALTESGNGDTVPVTVLWAGALAVVAAAIITAVAVHYQTKKTLAAEQKRLTTQLDHERKLREREELRILIDEAAARFDLLTWEAIELDEQVDRVVADEGDPSQSEEVDELAETLFAGIREADTLGARLAVRLGENHPTARIYRGCWQVYHEYLQKLKDPEGKTDPETFAHSGKAAGDFMRAANELVRSEL
jgi:hypothetical protein